MDNSQSLDTLVTTPWIGALRTAAIVGVVSAVINAIVFFVGQNVFEVPFLIQPPGGAELSVVPLPAIIFFSFIPAIGAVVLLLILARFTDKARLIFAVAALALLVYSFTGPNSQPTDGATKLWLNATHGVAAVVIAGGLLRMLPRDGSPV